MDQALYEKLTRQDSNKRLESLKQQRTGMGWDAHWRQVGDLFMPNGYRFFETDKNSGTKKHGKILDNRGIRAKNILSAGMVSGISSPSKPWFRLTSGVPELDERQAVKEWLTKVTRLMQMIFAKSNTYKALHTQYDNLGVFGTAAALVVPNFKNVIHIHNIPIGQYYLAVDQLSNVDTLYRVFPMTARQAVLEFGWENVSDRIKTLCNNGNFETNVNIIHAIEPRLQRDSRKRDSKNMPWRSVYFEEGCDKPLRESGFKEFKGLCPRWGGCDLDVYGISPAMEALGDNGQLQHNQRMKSKALDYKVDPPVIIPASMKANEIDTLPGGIIYDDGSNPNGIRTAWEIDLPTRDILEDNMDIRDRIDGAFYADLFMMMANSGNSQMTATEVAERHEEKLLMIGPVLERLHTEILSPLIDVTFTQMIEAGIVPKAPDEIQGRELNVEFVSILAQAQRAISANSVDRFLMTLGTVAQMKPEVLDKLDADYCMDYYSDIMGVDPQMVVPGDKVAIIREERAKMQQQQMQAEQMQQQAATVNQLAGAKMTDQSALTEIMKGLQGYSGV